MRIIPASDEAALRRAAEVHSVSWQDSHRAFCPPDFVAAHTPERQYRYLLKTRENGSRVYLLLEGTEAVALVTVTGSLIADLYVLPELRGRGYGSFLLGYAVRKCEGSPRLWILENNTGAERLYRRCGFMPTGRRVEHPGGFDEVELCLETG